MEGANLKEGDVMIHNAANGLVGQTLVQLAAARGIKVVSVVRQKVTPSPNPKPETLSPESALARASPRVETFKI